MFEEVVAEIGASNIQASESSSSPPFPFQTLYVTSPRGNRLRDAKDLYTFPIIGGRKVEHFLGELIAELSAALSDEHLAKVETASPFDKK